MSDEYHCRLCAERPRANLTAFKGRLWSPECLAVHHATQEATRGIVPEPEGTKGGVHGLRVVDVPRVRPLRLVK